MDRQCSSCGGFCRKSGCERENVVPVPEPVAWMEIQNYLDEENLWCERKVLSEYDNGRNIPLYTAQPQYEVPEGYALIGIDALKAWGVYEQVSEACNYSLKEKNI